jgi:hypothetical protein
MGMRLAAWEPPFREKRLGELKDFFHCEQAIAFDASNVGRR